jgi:hypothetical protein
MDVLRTLGNIAALALAALIVAFFWQINHTDPDDPFGSVYVLSFGLVSLLVYVFGGRGRSRH